ncbi:LacI family DNA-binding transcriptional regulator [Cytobacillus depressus]|uniref:LacI family DNA-binding transcriptional regulator n=1 Tax=Cytobacillus depressus TaxID=1602942 RepID=A0A6L3V1A8_9BACI|nr:substrate-binding domain-containing protein [Cytobacillus depressus]KAB2329547.1 LacI family DNA-binding transcriptional regulator [Cytobacillus depressus]
MKKVTMDDVARHSNVSKSTVSQYLNKRYDYMGVDTKRRIESAINELGYRPNFVARSLKQKRTSTIGVIIANILHSFSTKIVRAIEDVCNENDFHVIICNADDDPAKERKYINMLRSKQVDGIIVFPTGGNMELYQSMVSEKFPLIFVDRMLDELTVDTVLLDNQEAAYIAVEHFLNLGHTRIGVITSSLIHKITPRVERIEGYKKALSENGVPIKDEYIKGLKVEDMKQGLREMFTSDEPPTAILACNDLSLIEVLNYVKENGLSIPDELALIGIDDDPFANIFSPPLTTVSQPVFEMGKKAAELLLEKIKNAEREGIVQIYRFPPSLIVRRST